MKFGKKNWGKVVGKQLHRTRPEGKGLGRGKVVVPEIFFWNRPLKKFAPGPRQALGGPDKKAVWIQPRDPVWIQLRLERAPRNQP